MSDQKGDDPFRPRDATVLRPRPGAGKRGGPEPQPPRPSAPTARSDYQPGAMPHIVGPGLNPLVQAASQLLTIMGRVRGTVQGVDVGVLRRQVLDEIRLFEERARASGVANEVVLAARYVLCSALDEAVLSTPWGAQSDWGQQTLLVSLHRETWGGEKFFEMLERITPDRARHIDLMELQYLCLAMGFAGKYQVMDRGHERLADIRHALYRQIRDFRGVPPTELSLHWEGLQDRRNPLLRLLPWWVVGAAGLAILTFLFIFFFARLSYLSGPVEERLAKIGLGDFAATNVAVAPPGPSLKELLAPDERAGTLRVEEQGNRTLITLVAPNLFESASATVNPAYYETLRHVAVALDQVPGRILVTGHTDDQPVRSFRYRDNFELSRERAVAVVDILKLAIDNKARIQWTGVGATEPRYTPPSTPENRARNRRVEIVHVRGG